VPSRCGGFAFTVGFRGIDLFDIVEACLDAMANFAMVSDSERTTERNEMLPNREKKKEDNVSR
jgi:hypothetical protein